MNKRNFPNPMGEVYLFLCQPLSIFSYKEKNRSLSFLIIFSVLAFAINVNGQCDFDNGIGCNGSLNGTVGSNCTYNFTPSQVISNYSNLNATCQDSLAVHIETENGTFVGSGPTFLLDIVNSNLVNIGDSLLITGFHDLNLNGLLDQDGLLI